MGQRDALVHITEQVEMNIPNFHLHFLFKTFKAWYVITAVANIIQIS